MAAGELWPYPLLKEEQTARLIQLAWHTKKLELISAHLSWLLATYYFVLSCSVLDPIPSQKHVCRFELAIVEYTGVITWKTC